MAVLVKGLRLIGGKEKRRNHRGRDNQTAGLTQILHSVDSRLNLRQYTHSNSYLQFWLTPNCDLWSERRLSDGLPMIRKRGDRAACALPEIRFNRGRLNDLADYSNGAAAFDIVELFQQYDRTIPRQL